MMQPLLQKRLAGVINWMYVWLPRFTGCHQRPDRSFTCRSGRPFPVCARCSGELIGMAAAVCTAWAGYPPVWVLVILLVPMVTDGTVQLLTSYESTNGRRLVTGVLFGYGFAALLVRSACAAYWLGVQFGRQHIFIG